jgi:hypothetical protein
VRVATPPDEEREDDAGAVEVHVLTPLDAPISLPSGSVHRVDVLDARDARARDGAAAGDAAAAAQLAADAGDAATWYYVRPSGCTAGALHASLGLLSAAGWRDRHPPTNRGVAAWSLDRL